MDVTYQTQTNIADASKDYQMQKAAFDQEVNTKKADAELAYELQVKLCFMVSSLVVVVVKLDAIQNNALYRWMLLSLLNIFQAAKEKQKIRSEEIQITVVERRKQIEVEEKEILRKENELVATVKRPAEAESFKVETLAQGKRSVCMLQVGLLYYLSYRTQ